MNKIAFIAAGVSTLMSVAAAQPCTPGEGRSVWSVSGREVAGDRDYREPIDQTGWIFALVDADHGWDLRVFDKEGLDLTQMTPPLRGAPNPRQIYGWHFRNADNSGANKGDVNAPQGLRLFGLEPALTGTGGYKPSSAAGVDPQEQTGRGALTIRDMGLADLAPGEKARLNYLKFDVCMTWLTTDAEKDAAEAAAIAEAEARQITPELEEQIFGCGLSTDYRLESFLNTAEVGGDFDGDDVLDLAAPIVRNSDSKRGLAICRAGTWMHVVGMEGAMGRHVMADYFDSIDYWSLHAAGPVGQGAGEGAPPLLKGDGILIGKEGASSALLYWDGERFDGYWQGD